MPVAHWGVLGFWPGFCVEEESGELPNRNESERKSGVYDATMAPLHAQEMLVKHSMHTADLAARSCDALAACTPALLLYMYM